MSVYAAMLDLVNSEQDIAVKQNQNQYRLMEMSRIANQIDTDRQTRLISQQYQQAQDAAQLNADGQPMPQYGFQPGGAPVQSPEDANPDMASIYKELSTAQRTYQQQSSLAAALRRGGGNVEMAQKADDNARDAQRLMLDAQSRLVTQRKELHGEVGSIAQAAGPNNFPQVVAALDAKTPGWARGQDLDTDLVSGAPVWGPRTAVVMTTMAKQSETAYQQMELADKAIDQRLRQDDINARIKEYESRDTHRQEMDAARKDNLDLRQQIFDQNAEKTKAQIKKLQEGTIKALPQPTEHEVTDMAGVLIDDPTFRDLPPADRRVASRDLIRRTNKLVQDALRVDPNTQPDVDALRAQAMTEIKARVEPAHDIDTKSRTFSSYLPWKDVEYTKETVPPHYNVGGKAGTAAPAAATSTATTPAASATPPKIPATATSDQAADIADKAVMQRIAAVGISGSVSNGNVYGPNGGPVIISSKEQRDALPKGTPYVKANQPGQLWTKQ